MGIHKAKSFPFYSPSTLYLGQPPFSFTSSCCPPLCGSTFQTSNSFLHFRSTSPTFQETSSQIRHRGSIPWNIIITSWPHADIPPWWQQDRVDKMGQIRLDPSWPDEGCIRIDGGRTTQTKCQHRHRPISWSNHLPSICRSKNSSGNRQESNQLDFQRPLATWVRSLQSTFGGTNEHQCVGTGFSHFLKSLGSLCHHPSKGFSMQHLAGRVHSPGQLGLQQKSLQVRRTHLRCVLSRPWD